MSWRSAIRTRNGLGWLVVVMLSVALVQGQGGDSPIVAAAKAGDRAAVRRLIAARANVNAQGPDGSTALLYAAYNGDAEMARALIAAGARVDAVNKYAVTPLLQAARTGESAVIEALLAAGANANLTPEGVESPLMAAARTGKVDALRLLLTKGATINFVDGEQSESALMWAAAEGHLEAVNALIEAGATPNLKAKVTGIDRRHADHPTGGFTALHWAVRNGHTDVVKALVAKGADINATNGDNLTAMNIAIINDRFDMAKALLELGANPNDNSLYFAVDMHDATTDMRARDGGLLRWDFQNQLTAMDLMKLLLDKGADPNKAFQGAYHSTSMGTGENHNATPFFRAAVASDVEVLKVLVTKGANLEYMPGPAPGGRGGAAGRSALMVASTGGRGYAFGGGPGFGRVGPPPFREAGSRKPIEAVEVLLKAGADVNVQGNDDGNTLLHQAAQRNDVDLINLIAANSKPDYELYNWTGQRALDIAEDAMAAASSGSRAGGAPPAAAAADDDAPAAKATPRDTVARLRELMKLPPVPAAN